MTALAAARSDTRRKLSAYDMTHEYEMAASTTIYEGGLVALNASGLLVPASASTALRVIGRACIEGNGGVLVSGATGTTFCKVQQGIFNWVAGDTIVDADRGKPVFAQDDQTVYLADSGARPYAGLVYDVDANGVYVLTTFDQLATAGDVNEAGSAPNMQAVDATLVAGTVTIAAGIAVAATSEVIPVLIGDITTTADFGGLRELKASRVNGAAGVGTVVIEAIQSDDADAVDADAAGTIRVIILTP